MDQVLARAIGAALRRARERRGWTQERCAEHVGLSMPFYGRLERGGTLPSVETLLRLADDLEVSADELLGRKRGRYIVARTNPAPRDESPELRGVLRRLSQAPPDRVRLVAKLLATLERADRRKGRGIFFVG